MCNITIEPPVGILSGGNLSSILIEGKLTNCECKGIIVQIKCGENSYPIPDGDVSVDSQGNFTAIYTGSGGGPPANELGCRCGEKINIEVQCIGGPTKSILFHPFYCIECDEIYLFPPQDEICSDAPFQITVFNNGSASAEVTIDFGDSTTETITIAGGGNYQNVQHIYLAPGTYIMGMTVPGCEEYRLHQITVVDCLCCPNVTDVEISEKGCDSDCKREFEITTHYDSQSTCDPAMMQWSYHNSSGDLVFNGNSIYTGYPSPHTETIHLPDDQSPITATLTVIFPNGCQEEVRTIEITPCDACNCCPDITNIEIIEKGCNQECKREVEIKTHYETQPNCNSTTLQWVFSDSNGSSIHNGIAFPIGNPSPHSQTYSFANDQSPITATLTVVYPGGCQEEVKTIEITPCNCNCCPNITDINITDNGCNSDCEREVEIKTYYDPPTPGCYQTLEWTFEDKNGDFITTGSSIVTEFASPHIDTLLFSPDLSPITATLNVVYPENCKAEFRTIELSPCNTEPECLDINSVTHSVNGCARKGEECCREVKVTVSGDFDVGCGDGPKPKIGIDYGDGNSEQREIQTDGYQQVIFSNLYCEPGNYQVKVTILYPGGCDPIQPFYVAVPECEPEECEPPCPCCIWLTLLILSYFFLWALGYYQGTIMVLGVPIGIGFVAAGIYSVLISVIIWFCYRLKEGCKECYICRVVKCMYFALNLAAILLFIFIIILVVFGLALTPAPFLAMFTAAVSALPFAALMGDRKCQHFYNTGDCK